MGKPPPTGHAWFPIKLTIRGGSDGIDLERAAAKIADKLELQLGRGFDATAPFGPPAFGDIALHFTGAPIPPEHKVEIERATMTGINRSVRRATAAAAARGTTAPISAKSPAKPPKQRSLPALNTWYTFGQIGDEEYTYALAQALGQRFGDTSGIPHVYGVLFRIAGVPNPQLAIVIAGRYTQKWGLTRVVYTATQDAPASIDAGTGEFTLAYLPDGTDRYRELGIDSALAQLATRAVLDARAKHVAPIERGPDIDAKLAEHRTEAAKLVDAYMAAHAAAVAHIYQLGDTQSFTLLPLGADPAALLGGASSIEVIGLVRPVTDEEAQALDDDEAEAGDDSLLSQVPGDGPGSGGGSGGSGGGSDGGDGGGSNLTAESGGAGGRGIAIAPEYDPHASIYPSGPPIPGAKTYVPTCKPYDGEPPVDELGTAGQQMKRLIAEIAGRLDMEPCRFPANFCLSALAMIDVRRTQIIAQFSRDTTGTFSQPLLVAGRDRAGVYGFRPAPSVTVQQLRYLAATVPLIRRLYDLVHDHTWPRMPNLWFYGFAEHVGEAGSQACGTMYLYGCQIALDQLLQASKAGVEQRQQSGQQYIDMFEVLLRAQLADHVELILLSNALSDFQAAVGSRHGRAALEYYRLHQRIEFSFAMANPAAVPPDQVERIGALVYGNGDDRTLALQLADQTDFVFRRSIVHAVGDALHGGSPSLPHAGEIAENDDNVWTITDSKGQAWPLAALQRVISVQQQVVVGIDPLISQIANNFVDVVRPLVDGKRDVASFVTGLLAEMVKKNEEVSAENRAHPKYAFDHGQIHRVDQEQPALRIPTVTGGHYVLSGIHALAHELVGTAFEADPFYTDALDYLFGHAEAVKALRDDLVLFGSIVLSVICPPLGAAVGVIAGLAIGISDYRHAKEQEEIYGAVLSEDVLSYAEIQVELLVAKIGIAMSFLAAIPEVGAALKGVGAAAERLVVEGVEVSARAVARRAIEAELARLTEITAEKFVLGVARELAQATIMNKVFEALLTPFIEAEIHDLVAELADQTGMHSDDDDEDGE